MFATCFSLFLFEVFLLIQKQKGMAWLLLGTVSQALVAIDTLAHGVLSDLLSATGNNMDITFLGAS